MGLHAECAGQQLLDAFDFRRRDYSRLPRATDNLTHSRRGNDLRPAIKSSTEEQIAGKEGKRNLFDAVLPAMFGRIERQKHVESLIDEHPGCGFLMPMACIKRVPRAAELSVLFQCLNGVQLRPLGYRTCSGKPLRFALSPAALLTRLARYELGCFDNRANWRILYSSVR